MVGHRDVMDLLATNVVIVTALDEGQATGSTANCWGERAAGATALITLARDGRTHEAVRRSGRFGVSVLAADQTGLARQFARKEREPGQRFTGVATEHLEGVPILADCLAAFVCTVQSMYPFGEYDAVVGVVDAVRYGRTAPPLVFFDGTFGSIQPITQDISEKDT